MLLYTSKHVSPVSSITQSLCDGNESGTPHKKHGTSASTLIIENWASSRMHVIRENAGEIMLYDELHVEFLWFVSSHQYRESWIFVQMWPLISDFENVEKTENTRVSYPIHHIDNIVENGYGKNPKNIPQWL